MRIRWRKRLFMLAAAGVLACGMAGYTVKTVTATETSADAGASAEETVDTTSKDIGGSNFSISFKEDKTSTYTGSAITPEVVVIENMAVDSGDGQNGETDSGTEDTGSGDTSTDETDTVEPLTLQKDTDYKVTYADNIDVGTAKVTIEGMGSYTGKKELTFTINPKDISDLEMEGKDKVYRGTPYNADVNMYYNEMKLERSKDYRIKDYVNNENVGTASATVKGIGNYTGTRTMTFEITAQNILDLSYTPDLTEKTYTYTGENLTPKVTITFEVKGKENKVVGQKDLVEGVDYSIFYADNKKVGIAGVMIIGRGNFKGSKVMSFKIRPQETNLKKLVKGKKKIKVKWTKKTKQVTGYVVMCSTKKDFSSGVKKVKVKKDKAKYTFKNLKAKKRYYVKVRTYKKVAGITYYSAWSDVMKIKTK